MDENANVNNMNMNGDTGPNMTESNEGSAGPVIGTIIILAVIVLGGLYFWGQRASNQALTPEQVQEQVNTIQDQSASDAPADIEADLNATDINNIDSQLEGI